MALNARFAVSQIQKLEEIGSTYNIGVKDYPTKGDTTLIAGLTQGAFLALYSVLHNPLVLFSISISDASKKGEDTFYTATFQNRLEVYPSLHKEEPKV